MTYLVNKIWRYYDIIFTVFMFLIKMPLSLTCPTYVRTYTGDTGVRGTPGTKGDKGDQGNNLKFYFWIINVFEKRITWHKRREG